MTKGSIDIKYSSPKDEYGGLGNMAGGMPIVINGYKIYASEHLYLCGYWSLNTDEDRQIQQYCLRQKSGVYAKRCTKAKFRRKRHQLFRQWKDLSFEDYLERKDKMLSELVDNSLKHYKALDKELFKRGKQNGLLNHARKRAKRLLPSKPFKPKHFPTSSHISKK